MTRRPGFTLIEVLVVIAILVVVLPLAGATISALLRAQAKSGERLGESIALAQFSRAFRADVHAAKSVEVPREALPAGRSLILKLDPPHVIAYDVEPDGLVVRTVKNHQRTEHRSRFRLICFRTRFEIPAPREAVAALEPVRRGVPTSTASAGHGPSIRIDAMVGRDLRFESSPASAPKVKPDKNEPVEAQRPKREPANPKPAEPKPVEIEPVKPEKDDKSP